MRVVPSGVDIPEQVAEPAEPPHVLYVGRLSEEKGVAELLEATEGLARVIVGDGPLRDGVPEAVGFVPPGELGPYYERAAVVACPSHREGYGVVAREAMAYGRPVVASNVGGLPDAVEDGVTGLLVPPRDATALRAALVRLLDDPGLRRRLGELARARALERFSWDAATEATISAYLRSFRTCLDVDPARILSVVAVSDTERISTVRTRPTLRRLNSSDGVRLGVVLVRARRRSVSASSTTYGPSTGSETHARTQRSSELRRSRRSGAETRSIVDKRGAVRGAGATSREDGTYRVVDRPRTSRVPPSSPSLTSTSSLRYVPHATQTCSGREVDPLLTAAIVAELGPDADVVWDDRQGNRTREAT